MDGRKGPDSLMALVRNVLRQRTTPQCRSRLPACLLSGEDTLSLAITGGTEPVDGAFAQEEDAAVDRDSNDGPDTTAGPDAREDGAIGVLPDGAHPPPMDGAMPDADGGSDSGAMPIAAYGGYIPVDASKG